jgi:5-methylcytosine-specific restriction protein A
MIESAGVFEIGRVYRRVDIHKQHGGQRYGGISTPANQPWVMLITGKEGAAFGYEDERLDDGTLLYFGEGQIGDMTFTHGNAAIRDHAENGEDLFLFEKVREGYVRYSGQYVCAGYELRPNIPDRESQLRVAIVFQLVPHEQFAVDRQKASEALDEEVGDEGLSALREAALRPAKGGLSPSDARRRVWARSSAVRRYVLQRAGGRCEGCGDDAPFLRLDGSPYLEPHHTRRLTDGGPDHLAHVIALCPTCHSRVHYGADGASYNQLLTERLTEIESVERR